MSSKIHILHVLTGLDGGAARQVEELAILTRGDFTFTVIPYRRWRDIGTIHPDLVHTHGKGAGLFGRLEAMRLKIPRVHTLHGFHWERYGTWYVWGEAWLARWSSLIHVSEAEGAECGEMGIRGGVVIPNGVDIPTDRLVYYGPPLVGTVARDDPIKRLPDLRRFCREARLPLVIGTGPGPPPCTIYASFSRKEGCPYGMLDAMAYGLPIVGSDILAHRELLGSASTLSNDPRTFVALLRRLSWDVGWSDRLGVLMRQRATAHFSLATMASRTASLYRQCLDGGQGSDLA